MKRMSRIALFVVSAGLVASAQAADWMYTRASVGYNAGDINNSTASEQKIKKNYDWDVAVGKKIQDWRFEGAVGFLKVKQDAAGNNPSVDSQVMTYMANAYYDLPFAGNKDIVPHVGIGLGAADYQSDFTRFALAGNLGVNYRLDDHMWVNANYRYLEAQKGGSNDTKYKANTVNVGLAYAFS